MRIGAKVVFGQLATSGCMLLVFAEGWQLACHRRPHRDKRYYEAESLQYAILLGMVQIDIACLVDLLDDPYNLQPMLKP
jgi:hypothetical protein